MEHWKFLLPWYALLFPVSQLTLWCYLMRTILSDEVASAAWIATGVLLLVLCAVADLLLFKALPAKHAASHDRTASAADGKLGGDPAETGRGSGAGDGGGRPCASGDFCPAAGGGGAAAKPPHGGRPQLHGQYPRDLSSAEALLRSPRGGCHPFGKAGAVPRGEHHGGLSGADSGGVADPRRGIVCGAGQSDGQRHRSLPPSAGGDVPPDHGAWACERRLFWCCGSRIRYPERKTTSRWAVRCWITTAGDFPSSDRSRSAAEDG